MTLQKAERREERGEREKIGGRRKRDIRSSTGPRVCQLRFRV
jgi:hypothetical protein